MDRREAKTHATTISHTSTTNGNTTTTTTTITTTITTQHNIANNGTNLIIHSSNKSTNKKHKKYTFTKQVIDLSHSPNKLLRNAIDLYIRSHKYKQAFQLLSKSITATHTNPLMHYHYACICAKLDKHTLSTKHFELSIKLCNTNAVTHNNYAVLLSKLHRNTKSEHHFRRSIEVNNPKSVYICHYNYAIHLYETDQLIQCETHLQKALNTMPSNTALNTHILAIYGIVLMDLQKYELAHTNLSKAIQLSETQKQSQTDKAQWHSAYAQLLHTLQKYKECESHMQQCLELHPSHARYNADYGQYLMTLGKFKDSHTHFGKAYKIDSNNKEYRTLCEFAQNMSDIKRSNDIDKNFKNLEKDLNGTLTPQMTALKTQLHKTLRENNTKYQSVKKYMKAREYKKCLDLLQELIKSAPNHFDYHFLNAKALEQTNNRSVKHVQMIVSAYKQALSINNTHAGAHFNFAKLLVRIKRFKYAKIHFKHAMNANPNHCAYRLYYAILLMYNPLFSEDRDLLDDLESNCFEDSDNVHTPNPCIDYTESEKYFKECVTMHPKNAECNYKYGLLLTKMNRNSEALIWVRKANKIKNEKEKRYRLKYNQLKNITEQEKKGNIKDFESTQTIADHSGKVENKYDAIVIDSEDEIVEKQTVKKQSKKASKNEETKEEKQSKDKSAKKKHKRPMDKKSIIREKYAIYKKYMGLGQFKKARGVMKDLVSLDAKSSKFANEYGLLLRRDRKKISEAEKYFHIAMGMEPHNIIYKSNYGVLLFDNERYKESESYLKCCVLTHPNNAFYNHMYALLLQRQHKFHESFEYHQKAIQLDYMNEKYRITYNKLIEWYDQFPRQEKERMKRMYLEAESHAKHMEFEIAEPTFKRLVTKNPYNLVYVFRYAYVLQRLKKYALAEKYYKMCLNIEGDHNICHGDYGLLLSKLKRYKEADMHYKKCLYTDPDNWICRKNYAVSLEIRGRYKEAAKYFREALAINPNDRETNQRYLKLTDRIPKLRQYEKKARKAKMAQKQLTLRKRSSNGSNNSNSQNVSQSSTANNSNKKPRRRRKRGKASNGDPINEELEYKKVLEMIRRNDNSGALPVLKTLVSAQRNNFKYGLHYAKCLRNERLFVEAVKQYKRVLALSGNDSKRGEALYELGKISENEVMDLQLAAECFREAFGLNFNNSTYRQACQNCVKSLQLLEFGRKFSAEQRKKMSLTFESANEYIKYKNYREAKHLLEDILVINPDYFLYNAKYALVLHRLKMYKLAEKYFKKAINTDPTNSISRGVYGGMLFQLKRYAEAEQELQVCLAINPNNWICHQDYARLLEYKNDYKSAAFHSKKAFEINPSDHESYQRYQYLLKKIDRGKSDTRMHHKESNKLANKIVRTPPQPKKQTSISLTYTSKVISDAISIASSDSMGGIRNMNNIQIIEPIHSDNVSQQSRHHTRHSIASTQSPESGLHSPRSNYSSNNFALSPTRTIVSVSSNHNSRPKRLSFTNTVPKDMDPMSLSSMYTYDELQNALELQNDTQPNVITPRSNNSMFHFSNNASTPSLVQKRSAGLNESGFSWGEFDTAQQYMKAKNFDTAERILHDLVLSLTNIQEDSAETENIPYFDCIHLYGQCLYEMERFEDSMKYYKMALIYNDNHCHCNYKYAKLLKKFNQFEESRVYFEKCTQLMPGDHECLYQYGLLLELMNDQTNAIKLFEKAHYLKPDILKFKMKLDQIKLKQKNKSMRQQQNRILNNSINCNEYESFDGGEDEEKQNKITTTVASDDKLWLEAKHCMENKDWSEAKAVFAQLWETDSKHKNDFVCVYAYAHALRECKDYKECVKYYEMAVNINAQNALCFFEYGNVLQYEIHSINKAMQQYETCLKLTNDGMHQCLYDYAITLQKKKRIKDAAKYFKKAISECDKDELHTLANYHNRYGLLLRNKGKYLLANEQFKLAMSHDETDCVQFEANYAYSLFLNERYKESEVKILRCLGRNEENAFVNHVYALLLRRTNRFAEAFQYHHKAIQLNPHKREFKRRYDEFLEYSNRFSHDEKQKMKRKFDKAQHLIKTKHFDKARVLLKQLSTVNPYNIVYVFKFAFVLHRLKQYKEAEKYYKMALNVEGDHSICHFDYGLMLSKLRRLEEAKYHYKRCLHMNPSDWICHINYARLLEKRANFKDAAYHLEKALEINPNDAEAHQCYSQVVKKLKQQKHWTKKEENTNTNTSAPNKTNSVKTSPWRRVNTPSPKKLCAIQKEEIKRGDLKNALQLYATEQFTKCRQVFLKLLEMDCDNYDYVIGYARCLHFGLRELDAAEEQYMNALNIDDSSATLHYDLGLLLFDQSRFTEAHDFVVNALEMHPNNIEYNYTYARILEELNDYNDALTYFHKCDEIQSDYKDVQSKIDTLSVYSKEHLNMHLYESQEQEQECIKYIEQQSDSHSTLIMNQSQQNQSQSDYDSDVDQQIKKYMSMKDYRKAKQLLSPLMEDKYDNKYENFEYIIQYADILLKLNEFNESERYYKIALKLKPDEPLCYYNLGIICGQRHRNEEALMYLEKAAALNPNNGQFRDKYNELQQQQQQQLMLNNSRVSLFGCGYGSNSFGSLFDMFQTSKPSNTVSDSAGNSDVNDELNINSKPIDSFEYNSYLYAPYEPRYEYSIDDEYDEEKINLNGLADDIFGVIGDASINEEKTVEETQQQSYCEKQRRLEFRLFLQEKVQFNTQYFDRYFRKFVDKGLADIRMVPYLDEATLTAIGMNFVHQRLMLNKITQFQKEMKLFANLFQNIGIPTRYFNNFGDYGICTLQSFCNNFKSKSDLKFIMDNNGTLIDQLWTQTHKQYAQYSNSNQSII